MNDQTSKAFDFAQETTKQLLTLATGIIALSITFLKDFVGEAPAGTKAWAVAAWFVFLLSVVFGLLTLMSLTGVLGSPVAAPSIMAGGVRLFSVLQVAAFLIALVLTTIFGAKAT